MNPKNYIISDKKERKRKSLTKTTFEKMLTMNTTSRGIFHDQKNVSYT